MCLCGVVWFWRPDSAYLLYRQSYLTTTAPLRRAPYQASQRRSPPYRPIYPLAPNKLEALQEYLKMAQEQGWIRPSTSPAGAPIISVPKKGGKLQLCIDYRGLNKITVKNQAPLLLISKILDRLGIATIYTKLDLKDAVRDGEDRYGRHRVKRSTKQWKAQRWG